VFKYPGDAIRQKSKMKLQKVKEKKKENSNDLAAEDRGSSIHMNSHVHIGEWRRTKG